MKDYHSRESIRDLQQLRQWFEELSSISIEKSEQAHYVRNRLGDVIVVVEHLIVERLDGALHEDAKHSCQPSYEHRNVAELGSCLQKVISLANLALPDEPALVPLANDVHPAVSEALHLAVALHRRLDPAFAAEEDQESEVATPLRYRAHKGARELAGCPHCGASLSSGDRTFSGSYCENCRTRWDEEE